MKKDLFFNLVKRNFLDKLENSGIKMDKELSDYLIPTLLIFIETSCKEALETIVKLSNSTTVSVSNDIDQKLAEDLSRNNKSK
jgi:hypothetical protein